MSKQEKLVLLVVALLIISRFSGLGRDIYLAETYGATIPADIQYWWELASRIIGSLVNIGAAIWLYIEAKSLALKSWVWALLGLVFGLVGVILFYAVQIFTRGQGNEA